jgi:hypothetical protein
MAFGIDPVRNIVRGMLCLYVNGFYFILNNNQTYIGDVTTTNTYLGTAVYETKSYQKPSW